MYEKKTSDKTSLVIAIVAILFILGGVFLLNQRFSQPKTISNNTQSLNFATNNNSISTFEECKEADGTVTTETTVKKCVKDGKTYSKEISEVNTTVINSFEDCVNAKGVITETLPRKCTYNNKIYTESIVISVTNFNECSNAKGIVDNDSTPKKCTYNGVVYTETTIVDTTTDEPADTNNDDSDTTTVVGLLSGSNHAEIKVKVTSVSASTKTVKFTVTETGFIDTRWLKVGSYFLWEFDDISSYVVSDNYKLELHIGASQTSFSIESMDSINKI